MTHLSQQVPIHILKQIFWSALLFGLLFSITAVGQYYYVRSQLLDLALARALHSTEEVQRAVNYRDHWDLRDYIQAEVDVDNAMIVSTNGQIVDITGLGEDFCSSALLQENVNRLLQPGKVAFFRSSVGEPWLMIMKRVQGGHLILGIRYPEARSQDSVRLEITASKLEALTCEELERRKGRGVDVDMEIAVLDDSGHPTYLNGGIPFTLPTPILDDLSKPGVTIERVGSRQCLICSSPIRDRSNHRVGSAVVLEDLTAQDVVLGGQARFNWIVAVTSWLLIIVGLTTYFILREVDARRQEIGLADALIKGEGQTIEFKAGVPEEHFVETVAAFANSDGGNIFLGVDDECRIVGLREHSPHEKDKLLQRLRLLADQTITPRITLRPSYLEADGKTVLRIFIPRGRRPIYLVKGVAYLRQVNAVVKARAEDLEERFRRWKS